MKPDDFYKGQKLLKEINELKHFIETTTQMMDEGKVSHIVVIHKDNTKNICPSDEFTYKIVKATIEYSQERMSTLQTEFDAL